MGGLLIGKKTHITNSFLGGGRTNVLERKQQDDSLTGFEPGVIAALHSLCVCGSVCLSLHFDDPLAGQVLLTCVCVHTNGILCRG